MRPVTSSRVEADLAALRRSAMRADLAVARLFDESAPPAAREAEEFGVAVRRGGRRPLPRRVARMAMLVAIFLMM